MNQILAQYRMLPALTGRAFLPIAFLARLPVSMIQIGTVILVTTAYGSVATGGYVAGSLAAGAAVGGPVIGRLADRFGQRGLMLTCALVDAAMVLLLVALVAARAGLPALAVAAALAGASTPPVGALVRARWARLTAHEPTIHYAMSYEGAADEAAYVLGPAVTSLLATLAGASWAMVAGAALIGLFGSAVALHPTAAVVVPHRHADRHRDRHRDAATHPSIRTARMLGLMLGGAAIGMFFGSTQTAVTGIARAAHLPGSAGAMYAVMGIGSAIAALGSAAVPARFPLASRLLVFSSAVVVLALPLLLAKGVLPAVLLMLPVGCAIGPYLVTLMTMVQQQVPAGRVAGTVTLLSSATTVGSAVGAALGGALVQRSSPAAGFALAIAAMAVGALLSLIRVVADRRALSTATAAEADPGTPPR